MATNPYAAPQAHVADVPSGLVAGNFVPEGRGVNAGRGLQWIIAAWQIFKRQPWLWMGAMVVLLGAALLVNFIPILGQLAVTLLTPVIGAGLLACAAINDEGKPFTLGDVFAGFRRHTGRLIGIGVFSLASWIVFFGAIMAIGGGGMALAMMTGDSTRIAAQTFTMGLAVLVGLAFLIPFYMALWFAPALVLFNDYRTVDALKASFYACLKNIVPFLIYGLAFLAVGIGVSFVVGVLVALLSLLGPLAMLAMVPFVLMALVFGPVVVASIYTGYRDIFYAA